MTPEHQERVNWLCERIIEEQDCDRLLALVHELNDLLTREQQKTLQHRQNVNFETSLPTVATVTLAASVKRML
jgi:hypothetical protein